MEFNNSNLYYSGGNFNANANVNTKAYNIVNNNTNTANNAMLGISPSLDPVFRRLQGLSVGFQQHQHQQQCTSTGGILSSLYQQRRGSSPLAFAPITPDSICEGLPALDREHETGVVEDEKVEFGDMDMNITEQDQEKDTDIKDIKNMDQGIKDMDRNGINEDEEDLLLLEMFERTNSRVLYVSSLIIPHPILDSYWVNAYDLSYIITLHPTPTFIGWVYYQMMGAWLYRLDMDMDLSPTMIVWDGHALMDPHDASSPSTPFLLGHVFRIGYLGISNSDSNLNIHTHLI